MKKKKVKASPFRFSPYLLYVLTFFFLFCLEINNVGLSLRDKITLTSTLDFSWFSDLIERFLHGYLLGKDFTFTYGPLFQILYSLPSLIFHVPSYISVALSPLVSFPLLFLFVSYIASSLTDDRTEQILYILWSFLGLGFLISNHTDTIRILSLLVYGFVLHSSMRKKTLGSFLIAIFLPTVFGMYTYNLFVTTVLISILFSGWEIWKERMKRNSLVFCVLLLFGIGGVQVLMSFLLTPDLSYLKTSLDAVVNYKYVMNVLWTSDRSNVLLIFPLLLLPLFIYLQKPPLIEKTKTALTIITAVSFLSLIYGISRSDAGHFLYAVYPCIIAFYSILFFLVKQNKLLLILGIVCYVLIPFKPTVYNTLAPKNFKVVVTTIKEKPSFFTIYKLPVGYYFSEKEITDIASFANHYKNDVFMYPYDSFILNMHGNTLNSYALGLYTYSNNLVEKKTVENFSNHPPLLIILAIDQKGAVALDDIPNFTRNPLVATWMLSHYSLLEKHDKYIVLVYNPQKKLSQKASSCSVMRLSFNPVKKDTFLQHLVSSIKSPFYYIGAVRIPYAPSASSYLLFTDLTKSPEVASFFDTKVTSSFAPALQVKNQLQIIRKSPFLRTKDVKTFNHDQFKITCGIS